MQNSNNSPNDQSSARTSANSSSSTIPPFVSPQVGDVRMFGRGNRAPSEHRFRSYQLRSIRRSAISRVDRRRRYRIQINFSRRILGLCNEARRTLLSSIADALQIEDSPTDTSNRTENDRVSYSIELRVPNEDDSSLYTRDDDYPVNNVNTFPVNRNSSELNNTLVGNEGNGRSWSGVFNVFQNLFQRNSSSENRD